MLCFLALCQIICFFMYFYYFLNPEIVCFLALCQIIFYLCIFVISRIHKCYVFWHCARLFVYLCIFIISGIQKCYVFWHCARLFVYLCIYFISRSPQMLFSGTVPDYLFIYVFILFLEVQACYVFRHCALCKTGSSQWSVFETDITMSWIRTNTVNKHFLPHLLHIGLHQDIS